MPSALLRQACVREIAVALQVRRGRAWIGVIESSHPRVLAAWVEDVCSFTPREDAPTPAALTRSPSQWPMLLSGHRPLALSGLSALAEVRRARFAESSASLKGAALLRAIQAAPAQRLLLLLSIADRELVDEAVPALLTEADARYNADLDLPLDDGRPLHPLGHASPHQRSDVTSLLRDRVVSQRALLEGSGQAALRGLPVYWELTVLLGKLEIVAGDGDRALARLARAAQEAADTRIRTEALEAIGDLHLSRSALSQAAASYQMALDRARSAGHQLAARRLHLRLGDVCTRQGNYAQALEHYERGRGPGPSPDASTLDSAIREAQARLAADNDPDPETPTTPSRST